MIDSFDGLKIGASEGLPVNARNVLMDFPYFPDIFGDSLIWAEHTLHIFADFIDLSVKFLMLFFHPVQSLQFLSHLKQVKFVQREMVVVKVLIDAVDTTAEE